MRLVLCTVALVLAVAACGQVEPVQMSVSMPDCIAQGPDSMREGLLGMSLTLNGLSPAEVDLLEITGEHGYAELGDEIESTGTVPSWAETVITLALSPDDGVDGVYEESMMEEGEYAVLCRDSLGPRLARTFTVTGAR
jgi:hypothetical protein